MSVLPRKTQLIFAGSQAANPSGQISIFGSAAASSPSYSSDVGAVTSLPAWVQGWYSAVLNGTNSPPIQDFNAVFYAITSQLAYIFNMGMPEWDGNTNYPINAFCQGQRGSPQAGIVYVSQADNNLNNAVTNTTFWLPYSTVIGAAINPQALCRAWVYFNGVTGAMIKSFNVSSITALGNYTYLLNFPVGILSDANYAVSMSNSTDGTAPPDFMIRQNGDTKTALALMVRMVTGNGQAPWGGNNEAYVSIFD